MAESNPTQVILTDDGLKIIKAQNTADNAASGITNLNDPNLMSVIEKQRLEIQMDNFATIYTADKDIATSEGIDFTAYDTAYHAYLTYMTPLVADMTTYSPIVRATFNSMVTAVQSEQKRFNAATQAQYNQQINKAQTDISDGQTKYKALLSEAETMKSSVAGIADEASKAISNAGFASNMASAASQGANEASQAASRALSSAMSAESNASSAVAAANSTALAFGPVKQNADSAFANAMSAQNVASSAVEQALSAVADSKDAKQIAGAVSQSYKTLTDGSTMTIAELESGLAVKLTKTDLDGYATQTWTQNQVKMTADGINGTISSINSTVDGHTTSIHDIQADSKEFKSQFTTYKDTVDRHDTDISTLQRDSKSLSLNFDSMDSDNKTNQHNISELQQSAKEFNSTLLTVKNSGGGTNLIANSANDLILDDTINKNGWCFKVVYEDMIAGKQYTFSSDVTVNTGNVTQIRMRTMNDGLNSDGPGENVDIVNGHISWTFIAAQDKPRLLVYAGVDSKTAGNKVTFHHYQLETGIVAHDWSPAPEDNATVTALTQVKRTADSAQLLATNNQGDVAKLQVTAHGLQTTISDKVSSSQLTELSGQLTSKIKDLASSTDSSFRQTANDISGLVKKGDVVNQFNLDAGGALLSTSGNSTKIVFSSPNIIFDSDNPVQIPNANIPGKLTGKTFEAGTITATTKIIGTDIEAPLVHSPSGSFKLDGKTGDIIGASIHSDNNSWGIDKDGNINGVNIVANTFNTNNGTFKVDSNGVVTATSMTINGSVINGTTFNAGTRLNQYGNTSYPLTISSDGSVTSTSFGNIANDPAALRTVMKDGMVKTNFRGMNKISNGIYSAADIAMGAGQLALFEGYTKSQDPNFTATGITPTGYVILDASTGLNLHGDNQQITFNGTSDDVTHKGIIITPYGNINPNGTQNIWYVGNNMSMKTASFGMDADQNVPISLSRQTLVDEIGAMGNRLSMGRLLLHAVDGNAQMYLLNDGKPAFVSPTIYDRTYSNGANMFVTSSGRVGRSTSASKYKLAITRSDDTTQADRLMTLNPASWNDKVATEKMAESLSNGEIPVESEINLKRHYGLIAEDLRDAGLDEFLITGKDGQIEGIEYDRLWTVLIPKIKQLNNRINELERKTL